MKTLLLCFILSFSIISAFGQQLDDTSYTARNGMKFIIGEDLKLGQGSNFNKDFVFIYTNPNSLAGQIFLISGFAGYSFRIKDIKTFGSQRIGEKVFLVCKSGGPMNYWVDVESAIQSGEIFVPDKFQDKKVIKNETGIADELRKLKGLFDEGILTKEEYEAQKKKLLEK